jgi:NAD(P)-dependent dehydrogenase (short-subunit alcohol dehydrogenase family)
MIDAVQGALRGRVAAITGGSAGIGLACAERFSEAGMRVALLARRADRLREACDRIARRGGEAVAVTGDVTSERDVAALVDRSLAAFGRLDVLLCNAGVGYHGALEDSGTDIASRLLAVNVLGTFSAIRAALPVFQRAGRGHVVIVSSIAGRRGIGYMSAYSATKFAQVGLAEALRVELAGSGIDVSLVYPVSTETEFLDAMRRDYGIGIEGKGPRQSAAAVADAVHDCLLSRAVEVYPYRRARWLAIASIVAPGLADRLVRKYGRKRDGR